MNNLNYFRVNSGIEAKQLSRLLNVTVHTYIAFEQEKMITPLEIRKMLARIYDVDESELFGSINRISEQTKEELKKLFYIGNEETFSIFIKRLLGCEYTVLNYRTVNKIKNKIIEWDNEG